MGDAPLPKRTIHCWNEDLRIQPGEFRDLDLSVSESYLGMTIKIPVHVRRGEADGPAVFVAAGVHGDELNGIGAIRTLIQDETLVLRRGALVLAPVINVLGFERHSRYLPDRRDLNRCFPGSHNGSLASRLARVAFEEIVSRCQYGIDLHTAAVRRTNFPNIRADVKNPRVRQLAEAFGGEVIVAGRGPKGCLRRAATAAGCPTIVFEAGEVWKVEPSVVDYAVRGICNVLRHLEMIDGPPTPSPHQYVVDRTKWIRSERAGFLQFHVRPGEFVRSGDAIATTTSLLGREGHLIESPCEGLILGMTTLPATAPGEPICHLGILEHPPRKLARLERAVQRDDLRERVREDLASSFHVQDADSESGDSS